MKVLRNFVIALTTGANIATIAMLWLCSAATYISPATLPKLSLLPLAFPFFLAGNLLFIGVWAVVCRRRLWLPIVGLAVVWSDIRTYMPINLPKATSTKALHVLSYNTHFYGGKTANYKDGNVVLDYIEAADADIICLQESGHKGTTYQTYAEHFRKKGYQIAADGQQVIITRLPIITSGPLPFTTKTSAGMMATLKSNNDTILLINVYLQTNNLSDEVKDAYREAIKKHESDELQRELRPLLSLLTQAAPERAAQADSIAAYVASWLPRPVIITGDCNDTPISYPLRQLTHNMENAFRTAGQGPGITFKERGFPVRIDHTLYSPAHFRCTKASVDRSASVSDHFPLHTYLTTLHSNPE